MAESDISIVARDEASAALRGVADSIRELNTTIGHLSGMTGQLEQSQAQVTSFFSTLKAAAVAAIAVIGSRQLIGFAKEAAEAFNTAASASRGMSESNKQLADDMERVYRVSNQSTLALMKQAKTLGVAEDSLNQVAVASIGLAEATGQSLQTSMQQINMAINGNAGALSTYLPQLRHLSTEEEKLAAVTDIANAGLQRKLGSANELAGVMRGASNAVNNLYENVGELLSPALGLVYQATIVFADAASSALVPALQNAGDAAEWWANATGKATQYAVAAVAFVETIFQNFDDVVDLALTGVQLSLTTWVATLEHQLTVAVPAYISWFSENWVNIFRDLAVATLTIMNNLGKNLGEIAFATFDWISNGFEGGFSGLSARMKNAVIVGMLDGFEAQTQALPEIIERGITAEEQRLQNRMAGLGESLGSAFNQTFRKRMEGLDFEKFSAKVDLKGASDAAKLGGKQSEQLNATQGRLLTRGVSEQDQSRQIADNTKRSLEQLEKMNEREERRLAQQSQNVKLEIVGA